jgi:acetylornithine/N-succinyldiaminopimelate aminotransferase
LVNTHNLKYLRKQSLRALFFYARAFGLMIGVELPKACGDLVNIARDEYHTIINVTAGSVVRLLPTLNITRDQADQLIERLVKMIKAYLA